MLELSTGGSSYIHSFSRRIEGNIRKFRSKVSVFSWVFVIKLPLCTNALFFLKSKFKANEIFPSSDSDISDFEDDEDSE